MSKFRSLGKNVIINDYVFIRNPELVEIGDNVIIDPFTYISGKVSIGANSHIANNVTIQAGGMGVIIGDMVGIAAGARIFALLPTILAPRFFYRVLKTIRTII